MKLYFLTINEDLNSGLLKSQFIAPAEFLSGEHEVTIINICRVDKLYKKHLDGIKVINLPILLPYRFFMFNKLFFITPILAMLYSFFVGILLSFKKDDTLLIARSYFPSLVALFVKKIFNRNFVFDTRSLFIDENLTNNNFRIDTLNYKMWRYFEKEILKITSKTISVSESQQQFYKSIKDNANFELIPCFINDEESFDNSINRNDLGISDNDIVICYYGSLNNGWNNIIMYADFFNECIDFDYKIMILSQDYAKLKNDKRLNHKNIILVNTIEHDINFSDYFSIADYGVVLMQKTNDWETRLSVKFVEYMNNGLPVIVGEFVGEAVRYSKEYFHNNIIYYNKNSISNLTKNKEINQDKVRELFGINNAKKYIID